MYECYLLKCLVVHASMLTLSTLLNIGAATLRYSIRTSPGVRIFDAASVSIPSREND